MLSVMTEPQFGGNEYGSQPTPPPPPQPGYGPPPVGQYPQAYQDPSAPFGRHPLTGEPFSDKSKTIAGLLQLLDQSRSAAGVQIFIGGESDLLALDECSLVTAPYSVDGQVVGTLGVVGPTHMAYERVVPIVDITAKLLSSALSHQR